MITSLRVLAALAALNLVAGGLLLGVPGVALGMGLGPPDGAPPVNDPPDDAPPVHDPPDDAPPVNAPPGDAPPVNAPPDHANGPP